MFVVIEWNQASGQPGLVDNEVYDNEAIAQEVAADAVADCRRRGRRERYSVHALDDDALWHSDDEKAGA